jgi:hypothetical protein
MVALRLNVDVTCAGARESPDPWTCLLLSPEACGFLLDPQGPVGPRIQGLTWEEARDYNFLLLKTRRLSLNH